MAAKENGFESGMCFECYKNNNCLLNNNQIEMSYPLSIYIDPKGLK